MCLQSLKRVSILSEIISSDPLLPVTRTRKIFERFHRLMDEMYDISTFQLVTLWDRIEEEFCPSTLVLLFVTALRKRNIRRNTVAFIVVCPLTSLNQRKFSLNCAARQD